MELDLVKSHPLISLYLRYIENTESPRLYHIWSALSGISSCLGRRCWLEQGVSKIYANMFVVLVGPPAVRKSTALKLMQNILRDRTNVRFAPDDTGGQRQGIIAAMNEHEAKNAEKSAERKIAEALAEDNSFVSLAGIGGNLADKLGEIEIDLRDPHTLYVCQSELKAFLGENNTQMTTFMCKMYDGDPYDYRLKSSSHTLTDALLGLLGCTTPSEIALSLPHEAIGGGFTSRIIFVFADRVHRKIPRPTIDDKAAAEIGSIFEFVFHQMEGAFVESKAAANAYDEIYMRGIAIPDPRFVNYVDRRNSTHLLKVAMAFAASRKSNVIDDIDIHAADQLLMITEEKMPEALGEYGMSPLSAAKQKLLDYIKSATGPIPEDVLQGIMSKDMKLVDFKASINELINTQKIKARTFPEIGSCIIAVSETGQRKAKKGLEGIMDLLQVK